MPAPKERARSGRTSTSTRSAWTATGTPRSPPATPGVYKFNRVTGKIMWRWAARSPTSSSAAGVSFDWQQRSAPRDGDEPDVRQLGGAAASEGLARDQGQARRAGQDGDARQRVHAPAQAALGQPGNVERLPNGKCSSAGAEARLHRVSPPARSPRRPARRGNESYRAFRPRGRAAGRRRPRWSQQRRRQGDRARELERGDRRPRWQLLPAPNAIVGPGRRRRAHGPRDRAQGDTAPALVARGPSTRRGTRSRTSAPVKRQRHSRSRPVLAAGGAIARSAPPRPPQEEVIDLPAPRAPRPLRRGPRSACAARAGGIGTVVVTGARSGPHGRRLRAHSDGNGASFVGPTGVPAR